MNGVLEAGLNFKKDQKFVFIDFETEGLNLCNTKPFQLSWIVADRNNILEQNDEFIYFSDLNMSEGAARITKFDFDAYKAKAKNPKDVYDKFSKDLFNPENIIVGQNILNFDIYVLKNLQKLIGLPADYSYLKRCIDTKILFIALQKNIKFNGEIPFIDWQYKVNSIFEKGLKSSQQFMLNYFEIPHDKEKLHDSLYDIQMLNEIFKKLLMKFEVPDLTE